MAVATAFFILLITGRDAPALCLQLMRLGTLTGVSVKIYVLIKHVKNTISFSSFLRAQKASKFANYVLKLIRKKHN